MFNIPNVINVSDEQLNNIGHDIKLFKKRNNIYNTIGMKVPCNYCSMHDSLDTVFPIGNVESKIMFVCDKITKQDIENKTCFTDGANILFQILLEKMGIKKDNIYMTSLYKCLDADESCKFICTTNILSYELSIIKPKIVVGLGIDVAKYLFPVMEYKYNVEDIEFIRNRKHNLKLLTDQEYNFIYIQTYDTDTLSKDFENLSAKFANDIQVAVRLSI